MILRSIIFLVVLYYHNFDTEVYNFSSQPPPAVELSHGITPACGNCSVLRSQLLEAVGILNGRSALQYGDMMQEKFSLETQVGVV